MKKRDYNQYDFASWVKLDETSPSGLSWVAPRLYSGMLKYERVGEHAGTVREFNGRQSYYMVGMLGSNFFAHRVVYVLKHGKIDPHNDIDHIDGDSLNNSVENLREIDPVVNGRNKRKLNPNKALATGVYYEELLSKKGLLLKRINAHASIESGRVLKTNFSVLKYGYDKALELALAWRAERMKELCEQGFGYTERHGT